MTKDTFYNCKLQAIGYDVTIAHTETNPAPSRKKNEAINIMETLRRKEKDKFQRGRGMSTAKTCIQDGITLSGEQISEQLYKTNQQLILHISEQFIFLTRGTRFFTLTNNVGFCM